MAMFELMIKIKGDKSWKSTGRMSSSKAELVNYQTICNADYKIVPAATQR